MYSDDVAKIVVRQQRVARVPELILLEIELDFAGGISQMREGGFSVRAPGDDSSGQSYSRTFLRVAEELLRIGGAVLAVEGVRVRVYPRRLQRFELLPARLENEVELFAHAAAVVDPPPCFRYASMNGSIPPSITFWTSGIFSSVRWSLTMVYGWNT